MRTQEDIIVQFIREFLEVDTIFLHSPSPYRPSVLVKVIDIEFSTKNRWVRIVGTEDYEYMIGREEILRQANASRIELRKDLYDLSLL